MSNIIPFTDSLHEREKLLEEFVEVRRCTELICAPLSNEDLMLSVTEETSPPKWHLAHTTWFFDKFILEALIPEHEVNPEINFLFNSYYKSVGPHVQKVNRGLISRPSSKEILDYRNGVTDKVYQALISCEAHQYKSLKNILLLGVNHEQQHQELLLMDIKRNFFANPLRPRYEGHHLSPIENISKSEWQNIPSSLVEIGMPKKHIGFYYDNEGGQHKQWVDSFMLSSHLVTNGEYLDFIENEGYQNPLLWLSDGWDIKEKENWSAPLYWEKKDDSWWVMSLSGMIPLDLAAPVAHISYYEAQAFAEWKGCRLPTEFEWEAAAKQEQVGGQFLESGPHDPMTADLNFSRFSQIHGTLWEWTQSAYLPYPKYESFSGGLSEYNKKFMCNQFVLRGGSCITPESHYRTTYRNFYYPYMRWQYCGLRLAKDLA